MRGHSSISALLVNAEVDSMGGVVDCGVGLDTKASPLRAAIERAQAELRQEYDVREERRRELEFLENGGNPLDFKTSHAASISVQSTSITDQLAEQYVLSEAKGSFALAPSPHGDSVESSGRPGGSLGREPNIADNLLLFDGENSNVDGERNTKFTGKRGNGALLEQSSQIDGCHNAKDSEDSIVLRAGFKRQAYARRNRSRTSRDSAHVGSVDLILGDSNKSSIFPTSRSESKERLRIQEEDRALSSISNSKESKQTSLKCNTVSKISASEDQLDMELDTVRTQNACSDTVKMEVPEGETEINPSDSLRENDCNNQGSHEALEEVPDSTVLRSSNYTGKDATLESAENIKEFTSSEKVGCFDASSKALKNLNDDLRKSCDTVTEVISVKKNTEIGSTLVIMSSSIGQNAKNDECSMLRTADGSSIGDSKEQPAFQETLPGSDRNGPSVVAVDAQISANDKPTSVHPNTDYSSIQIKDEVDLFDSKTDLQSDVRPSNNLEVVKLKGEGILKSEIIQNCFGDSSHSINKAGIITSSLTAVNCDSANATLSKRGSTTTSEFQNSSANHFKLAKKAHEDAILKEARIIEANLRRAGKLSLCSISLEKRKKCHWDFVLEEMTWMANDFMQERVWKTTAAAQVCHNIAFSGLLKFEQENMRRKQRSIARTLAKSVMHFWHSAEIFRSNGKELIGTQSSDLCKSSKSNGVDAERQEAINHDKAENSAQIFQPAVQGYAVRFLNYISSTSVHPVLAEAPTTPDRTNDAGILEMSWEDQLSEESLFYTVAPVAMQAYRESVESQWGHCKKTINTFNEEECETSICDSIADGPRQNSYDEDASQSGTFYFPGAIESGLSSKKANRKREILQHKSYAGRMYEVGSDMSYDYRVDSKPVIYTGKRPSGNLNVGSVPTKRVRTAARQRVVSPFSAGVTGNLQVTSKTDVSSGDTNSFQDDQSSPHCGYHHRRNLEPETTAEFDRQLPFDGCEISSKSKKKKKPKHLGYKNSLNLTDSGVLILPGKGSLYEQKSTMDSMNLFEQRDHMKKRLEGQHFESNGNRSVGHYGQYAAKKPKLTKQFPEASSEAIVPFIGSMPSPVASQMSNMSGPNKSIKLNKDRGRKTKGMKIAAGQSGSGNPWSNFEEQALVVLVHDMGTNWELISDAINSTLQFKRVFRTPTECKERHKFLMESNVDGADSAEDSGSSQHYRSTLPGIPKGSARQLFQRLQAPVEEDTLKAHFEKIILIGQKLHACRSQNNTQEIKVTTAHSSHMVALSQMYTNNLSGGVPTPIDLCDATTSGSDVLTLGYQGSHTNGLSLPGHQSSGTPTLPNSGANTMLQGSPSMVLGNSLPSPSGSLSGAPRDAQRYGMPRPTSLPADDQQRMQQYSQMLSSRNIQQPNMSIPGALSVGVDRSVRMLPGANGMGMMPGINRGMPMQRPGLQGISPPGMLNMVSAGNMLSTSGNGVGMQSSVNVHPSAVSGPGNSLLRPRDTLQMLRPGQNTEEHRQMIIQELQLQVSQGNCQSVTPFNGISAPFSNATVPPPVQTFPAQQHQQTHQMPQQSHVLGNPHHPHIQATNQSTTQQQAYAIRFAKERQHQQRMMPQLQHPFTGPNTASSIPNSSQIQQQAQSSSSGNPIPSSQAQHKQQQVPRNAQSGNGMPNATMKQRQRPQVQHSRAQQQQRQQSQQQAKIMKGLGRGNMMMHQNLSVDGSHVSGLSTAPKNQVSEKHPMQMSQGFFPGSSVLNPTLPQPLNQPKMYPHPLPQSSKPISPVLSQSDIPNQGLVQVPSSHSSLASQQSQVPSSLPLTAQQQQRQTNQPQQNMQRLTPPQNRQMNSDSRMQSSADLVHVNQMIPATSIPQCTNSSAPVISSGIQWKPEPSYDTSTPTPTAHLASSPQENLAGTETLPPSSQGLGQRPFSGSVPLLKHGSGGQWQQQQQPQQQQTQPQLQHRQVAAQGNLYVRSSNSGPG